MTATVEQVMQRRLTRGTPVIVADSFGKPALRGVEMIVGSKSTVRCNGAGRCAGDWCAGLAVFVTTPGASRDEKKMGWRGGTTKICLTHLKNKDGELVLPPPPILPLARLAATPIDPEFNGNGRGKISEDTLSEAHASGDIDMLLVLARKLKAEADSLARKVIDVQDRLIEALESEYEDDLPPES